MPDEQESQPFAGEFPVVPQQDRALVKRQALLDSAQALFAKQGYEKTTAKEIAREAGVAVGTFYRYFTDKRQVLMTLLQDRIEEFLPATPQWLTGDPEAALVGLLERHAARRREFRLAHALQELVMHEPEVAKTISEARQQVHARLVELLRQERALGLVWPDIDLDTTAWAILALVDQSCQEEDPDRCQGRRRNLARLICRMVVPPDVLARLKGEADAIDEGTQDKT
ncbi:MAG TPA: TetR/AcrR family transcriptional regulator [Symbiobacteriaceae bacterium]|nr:TetR/AcrR family transcriptional regulator [Symbiobacteriaceae bacterium]